MSATNADRTIRFDSKPQLCDKFENLAAYIFEFLVLIVLQVAGDHQKRLKRTEAGQTWL